MTKLSTWQTAIAVFLLCVAAAMTSPAQTFATLANFDGDNGATPTGTLIQGIDGNLYGMTELGGAASSGTIFKITTGGTLTKIHTFEGDEFPWAGLVLGTDGNFYGTTRNGGGNGTVFKITPAGALTTLHRFCSQENCADGNNVYGGLVQGADGNFYGTTTNGGLNGFGTVFRITPGGVLTTLHSFDATDGSYPQSSLVEGFDGSFYGTTLTGGILGGCGGGGCGTVFRITPSGKLTSVALINIGFDVFAGLVQASDGNFYGVSKFGGGNLRCSNGCGALFVATYNYTLDMIHGFRSQEGAWPMAAMIQATDGNLYGTTMYGGAYNEGAVFQITLERVLTTVHSFDVTENGNLVYGGLLQATNGKLYGTTADGGGSILSCITGCGTVFSLDMGLGPFVSFVRNPAKVEQAFGILGQGFTGTSSVSLNGTPASFTVVSDTFLKATVPTGATTGYVTVTTPSGTLTSNVPFHVLK